MQEVVIAAAGRSAVGNFGGTLAPLSAAEIGAQVIRGVLGRAGIDPAVIDEVVLGQVLTAACGMNPARQSSLNAGLPITTPAMTINKVCGSGLKTTHMAAQAIGLGDAEVMLVGGQESMSNAPHALPNSRKGQRMGPWKMEDTMIRDGLWDVFNDYHMGVTAENLAKEYGISREEQDAFAAQSSSVPRPRRKPDISPTRSFRWRFRSERVTRWFSIPTSSRVMARRWRRWQKCARPLTRKARSQPATPRALTTARRFC